MKPARNAIITKTLFVRPIFDVIVSVLFGLRISGVVRFRVGFAVTFISLFGLAVAERKKTRIIKCNQPGEVTSNYSQTLLGQ